MKFLTFLVLALGNVLTYGQTFRPLAGTEIVWRASTTNLPDGLWVYKVVPQNLPMVVVSNAMAMASFPWKDRRKAPAGMLKDDRNLVHFRDTDDPRLASRQLNIYPSLGVIEYHDGRATHESPDGVPGDDEVEALGLHYLFLLGIDRSELSSKPRSRSTGTQNSYHYHGKLISDGIFSRGVFFVRRVDGVDFNGIGMHGGFYIEFGNHGAIRSFDLTWRNLLPYEAHTIFTSEEMMAEIKSGKGSIPMSGKPEEASFTGLKKLTVTKITPYYAGASEHNSQEFVSPFAELEIIADTGSNNFTFQLHCPILSTNTLSRK